MSGELNRYKTSKGYCFEDRDRDYGGSSRDRGGYGGGFGGEF